MSTRRQIPFQKLHSEDTHMPVTNTIFKILCFQYFNFPDFHLPGISECCYIYYSPPNLYFSVSLLSNERVQLNVLIQWIESSLLLTCVFYFNYYIFHLIYSFYDSCSILVVFYLFNIYHAIFKLLVVFSSSSASNGIHFFFWGSFQVSNCSDLSPNSPGVWVITLGWFTGQGSKTRMSSFKMGKGQTLGQSSRYHKTTCIVPIQYHLTKLYFKALPLNPV